MPPFAIFLYVGGAELFVFFARARREDIGEVGPPRDRRPTRGTRGRLSIATRGASATLLTAFAFGDCVQLPYAG